VLELAIQQSSNPAIQQSSNPAIQQSSNPAIQQSSKKNILDVVVWSWGFGIKKMFGWVKEKRKSFCSVEVGQKRVGKFH